MSDDKTSEVKQTREGLKTLQATLNNPAYRIPVDMNIKKFKKLVDGGEVRLSKPERNRLIKMYKQKAWTEYDEIVQGVGSFPTRTVVEKTSNGETSGKQRKQKTDISLA